MTAVPDIGLVRAIPEAGRSLRPRRAVVGVSLGVGNIWHFGRLASG